MFYLSPGLIGSCVAIFVLAVLYEGLKVLRETLRRRYSYVVTVDFTDTKVYGSGPTQTTVVTESKGNIPRYDVSPFNLLQFSFESLHKIKNYAQYYCRVKNTVFSLSNS